MLLIDDQAESLLPLNLILSALGVNVTMVFDGFAARRALRDRRFDLVVIDWRMPDLSGGECLAFADTTLFLENRTRPRIPVVVYSGLDAGEIDLPELTYFYQIGHWRKPMRVSELTQRVTALINRME